MSVVVARTARQVLREETPDDAAALLAMNDDPEVMRYLTNAPHPFDTVEEGRRFLVEYNEIYRRDGFARWACDDAATGELLGWCGLRRQSDGEVDLGYRYRRACWGKGYATEASRACLDLAFDRFALESVIAVAHPENAASIRVMQKLGLVFEGMTTFEGEPAVKYRITAGAWRARRHELDSTP
jgi:RimJ/RimL family protein N-acetyltransferase